MCECDMCVFSVCLTTYDRAIRRRESLRSTGDPSHALRSALTTQNVCVSTRETCGIFCQIFTYQDETYIVTGSSDKHIIMYSAEVWP